MELAKQTEKDPRVVELMLQESNEVLRTRIGTIVVEHRLDLSVPMRVSITPT